MSCPPLTVLPSESLERAFRFMRRNHFSNLPVVSPDGAPQGVVTERSLLHALADTPGTSEGMVQGLLREGRPSVPPDEVLRIEAALSGHLVSEVMEPVTAQIGPGDSVDTALTLMEAHGLDFLPVVEAGRVVGVLAAEDLGWLLEMTHAGACLFG